MVNRSIVEDLKRSPCLRARCSHLCSGLEAVCSCPIGMSLNKDEKTCFPSRTCRPFEFLCRNGHKCIHWRKRCDGSVDCGPNDSSDEKDCGNCRSPETFLCGDGKCLNVKKYCDGMMDCPDNSDESHCRCPHPGRDFDCSWLSSMDGDDKRRGKISAPCVHRSALCDFKPNCSGNGADEHPVTCPHRDRRDRDPFFPRNNETKEKGPDYHMAGIVGMVVLIVVLLIVGLVFVYRRSAPPPPRPQASLFEMAPLNPENSATGAHTVVTSAAVTVLGMDGHPKINIRTTTTAGRGTPLQYYENERSNLTGKSSSSGDRSSFPEQPAPPPSVISTGRPVRSRRSRRKKAPRKRAIVRSPPPPYSDGARCYTPCSTEVMDGDSEIPAPPSSVVSSDLPGPSYANFERRVPTHSLGSVKRKRKCRHALATSSNGNSEVYNPLVSVPDPGTSAPNPSPEQSQTGTDSDLYPEYLPPPPSPSGSLGS